MRKIVITLAAWPQVGRIYLKNTNYPQKCDTPGIFDLLLSLQIRELS